MGGMTSVRRQTALPRAVLIAGCLLDTAVFAACPEPIPADVLDARVTSAEVAYGDLDVDGFRRAIEETALAVPCLHVVIAPSLAARTHRALGLGLYVDGEEARAAEAFAAARSVDSTIDLPAALVPPGHAVRDLFVRIDLSSGTRAEVPPPASGWLAFDGTRGDERPSDWPTIAQVLDADGAVVASDYALPGEPLPAYQVSTAWKARKPARGVLLGVAGGLALGAAFAYGLGVASENNFHEPHPDWDRDDLLAARARTNGLTVTAVVLGTAALGSAAAGIAVGPR